MSPFCLEWRRTDKSMKPNTLYYGDCLEVIKDWPEACVDLIYLDPPFNSNARIALLEDDFG